MSSTTAAARPIPAWLWLVLGAWLAASAAFAASGLLARLPPFAIPPMIWGPVILWLLAAWRLRAVREAVGAIPVRVLVSFHLVRGPIGAAFLVMAAAGSITPTFAHVAGPGDLAVAALAVPALACAWSPPAGGRRWLVLAWNAFGLIDILAVFVTAQRVIFFGEGMQAMGGFFEFPFPMIPTFVVPVVILTHVLIFVRLRRDP